MAKKVIIVGVVLVIAVIALVLILQEKEEPKTGGDRYESQFSFNTDTIEITYQKAVKVYKNDDRKGILDIVQKLDYDGMVDDLKITVDELVNNADISMDFKNPIKAYIINKDKKIYVVSDNRIVQHATISDEQLEYFKGLFEE